MFMAANEINKRRRLNGGPRSGADRFTVRLI